MRLVPQTLGVLLEQFGGTLMPLSGKPHLSLDASTPVYGFHTLSSGLPQHISFLTQTAYKTQLLSTKVPVVMMAKHHYDAMRDFVGEQPAPYAWVLPAGVDAYLTYAKVQQWWVSHSQLHIEPGIHPSAVIDPTANVSIEAIIGPQVVIGANAKIGVGVQLYPGVVIGRDVVIGAGSVLYPNAVVYDECIIGAHCIVQAGAVIGADGFGFAPNPVSLNDEAPLSPCWVKIPQLGRVVLADHVEVGANTTIDRGALDDTLIGFGVKLDNQIQIAHNVQIGNHTAMAGCVGVAGSTRIGARCTIGGAAMILGHLHIADGTHISAASTVMNSIAKAGSYTGIFPLDEHKAWERNAVMVRRLKELRQRVRALEQVHLTPTKP